MPPRPLRSLLPTQALASATLLLGWPDAPVLLTPLLRALLRDTKPFQGRTAALWSAVRSSSAGLATTTGGPAVPAAAAASLRAAVITALRRAVLPPMTRRAFDVAVWSAMSARSTAASAFLPSTPLDPTSPTGTGAGGPQTSAALVVFAGAVAVVDGDGSPSDNAIVAAQARFRSGGGGSRGLTEPQALVRHQLEQMAPHLMAHARGYRAPLIDHVRLRERVQRSATGYADAAAAAAVPQQQQQPGSQEKTAGALVFAYALDNVGPVLWTCPRSAVVFVTFFGLGWCLMEGGGQGG